jgi:dihydropteroate synthase
MHMRGDPDTMMEHAHYGDLLEEIGEELRASVAIARSAGIPSESLVLDPGIGFAKDPGQSLLLLKELDRLLEIGFPLLVGPSRKSFIGAILDVGPKERLAGTVAACVLAYQRGARIFRVHDVQPVAQALKVAEAIETSQDVPGDGENASILEGAGGTA